MLWSESIGARIARPSLSGIGEVVEKAIENIPNIYKSISIDKYVIMPNHIHLILVITNDHTIRDESEYQRIWQYIDDNPAKWDEDCYHN